MFKGRKFKNAEKEFADGAKSFDLFCAENNIKINNDKKKNAKRNVWISISATAVVAVIVVCGCIPLMRQTPIKEHYYSDGDVTANRITINDIVNDSNRDFRLFNIDYIDDYAFAQSVHPNNSENSVLGYNIKDVLWYKEYENIDYVFEFDYIVRIDSRYRFKDLALYNDCSESIYHSGINYKYCISDNGYDVDVFITYAYRGIDYFVHMFESEFTSEYNKNNVETFIKIAF